MIADPVKEKETIQLDLWTDAWTGTTLPAAENNNIAHNSIGKIYSAHQISN
jgi:hypothetical protein